MKRFFLMSILSLLLFSGCDKENDSIRICTNFLATVVANQGGKTIVELDGGEKYYTAQAFDRVFEDMKLGDRLYLSYFEINYDNQIAGADGSLKNPYEITSLMYQKMETMNPVLPSDEIAALENSELDWFYPVYLEQTSINRNYLNLNFVVPAQTKPKFNLIYRRTGADTLYYDFKATYTEKPTTVQQSMYIETVEMVDLPQTGYIHITFHAKSHEKVEGFKTDSTFVLPFTLQPTR